MDANQLLSDLRALRQSLAIETNPITVEPLTGDAVTVTVAERLVWVDGAIEVLSKRLAEAAVAMLAAEPNGHARAGARAA